MCIRKIITLHELSQYIICYKNISDEENVKLNSIEFVFCFKV